MATVDPSTGWQPATVTKITPETARAKTFRLALGRPTGHRAGQHYVLRLTAPDGYTASRSYSVASAPGDPSTIDLTVERLDGGEVSAFLHDVVVPGDVLDVRGPIGGWFVWDGDTPALLVGGGSGIVPLMSMLRHARAARAAGAGDLVRMLVSVRTPAELYYRDELPGAEATVIYTREAPSADWTRPPGRLTDEDVAPLVMDGTTAYVCGSSGFADAAALCLQRAGVASDHIRVERFGPT